MQLTVPLYIAKLTAGAPAQPTPDGGCRQGAQSGGGEGERPPALPQRTLPGPFYRNPLVRKATGRMASCRRALSRGTTLLLRGRL